MPKKDEIPIQAVVFDLFGTLVDFSVMHHPFRKVLQWAKQKGRRPANDDARQLLTTNQDGGPLLAELGIYPPETMLQQLQRDIDEELAGQRLFDDVLPVMDRLVNANIPITICSNLAKPYGAAIERLLQPRFDLARCLSYEEGAIKPESEMYERVVYRTGVPAKQTLFVGDTYLLDYEGPKNYGFQALHLARGRASEGMGIRSLREILPQIMPI